MLTFYCYAACIGAGVCFSQLAILLLHLENPYRIPMGPVLRKNWLVLTTVIVSKWLIASCLFFFPLLLSEQIPLAFVGLPSVDAVAAPSRVLCLFAVASGAIPSVAVQLARLLRRGYMVRKAGKEPSTTGSGEGFYSELDVQANRLTERFLSTIAVEISVRHRELMRGIFVEFEDPVFHYVWECHKNHLARECSKTSYYRLRNGFEKVSILCREIGYANLKAELVEAQGKLRGKAEGTLTDRFGSWDGAERRIGDSGTTHARRSYDGSTDDRPDPAVGHSIT